MSFNFVLVLAVLPMILSYLESFVVPFQINSRTRRAVDENERLITGSLP